MANSSITLTNLDFDTYKAQLKQYLKSQTVFKDYDFDASQLSVLLDLLAYNTYQNGFYLNMVGNEMFLDTAQLRDSIVSHAKELNYTPRSFASALATLELTITSTNVNKTSISIPKGTKFSSKVGNQNFIFTTDKNILINKIDHYDGLRPVFVANVDVYEGIYLQETFASNQRTIIGNERVDLNSLTVTVIEDNGSVVHEYLKAESLFGHDSNSKIFFIQGTTNNRYEVVFGDGLVGRKPKDNSLVVLDYRISSGELANGAKVFRPVSSIDGETNIVVDTIEIAGHGAVAESNESIRFNAPRHFTTQERAVTAGDYENLLKANFSEINAVVAYGGEDATPPQYGKVFISLDLVDLDYVPDSYKSIYYNFLKARSPLSIDPVFVDPEYLYIRVSSIVNYDSVKTNMTVADIKQFVAAEILDFSETNLNNFGRAVRYSRLIEAIDDTADYIISNETVVDAYKNLNLYELSQKNITLDFGFAFSDISSDIIRYSGQQAELVLEEDGTIALYSNDIKVINMGTADLEKGTIALNQFSFDNVLAEARIFVKPAELDIEPPKNTVVSIKADDIIITPVAI